MKKLLDLVDPTPEIQGDVNSDGRDGLKKGRGCDPMIHTQADNCMHLSNLVQNFKNLVGGYSPVWKRL